jgi:hypothetical protein
LLGSSSGSPGTCGVNLCMGTAAGISLPSASAPVNKEDKCISDYDYFLGVL